MGLFISFRHTPSDYKITPATYGYFTSFENRFSQGRNKDIPPLSIAEAGAIYSHRRISDETKHGNFARRAFILVERIVRSELLANNFVSRTTVGHYPIEEFN